MTRKYLPLNGPVIAVSVLLLIWLAVLARFYSLPFYMDSLYTVGAGARLAHMGHFSSTFMLYGLINPFIEEVLLIAGLGSMAPFLLRIFQFVMVGAGFFFLYLTSRTISRGENRKAVLLSIAAAVLSSTIMLIESFELTPETSMFLMISILMFTLTTYRPCLPHAVMLGTILALLIGTRPTALVLAFPMVMVLPEKFSEARFASCFWRWSLFAIAVLSAVISGFPGWISTSALISIGTVTAILITVFAAALDCRKRHCRFWTHLFVILLVFPVILFILFPHYFLYHAEFFRQLEAYHLDIEQPIGSLTMFFGNAGLGFMNLFLVFTGPLAATGLFAGLGFLLSDRSYFRRYRLLILFAAGLLPFFLLVMRNTNLQPRYLIPLLGPFFILSAGGLKLLWNSRRIRILLAIPLLMSLFQLTEVVRYKHRGGILNALRHLGELKPNEVLIPSMTPFDPQYYSEEDNVRWPLVPFFDDHLPIWEETTPDYLICSGAVPEGYEIVRSFGDSDEVISIMVRGSAHPGWANALYLMRSPWKWRNWGIVHICIRPGQ